MIRRYVYGNVIETEAVLNKPEQENGALPYFTVDEQAMTLSYTVDEVDFDHPECIGFVENVAEYGTTTITDMRKITRIRRTSPFFVWKQKNKTDITVKEK